MASNAFVALGGLAHGMGQAMQQKKQQEHDEEQKHLDMVSRLVTSGITQGTIDDPNAAFEFLLSGGKASGKGKGGKGGSSLPQPISHLIDAIGQHGAQGTQGGQGGQGGQGAAPPQGPEALSTFSPPAPAPGTPQRPSPGVGFSFMTGEEMDTRQIARQGNIKEATTTQEYTAKVNLARRMFSDGLTKSLDEAFERVGLKQPQAKQWAPHPVGRPVAMEQIPEGALTVAGEPVARTPGSFMQPVVVSGPNGMETRFEPSGQVASGAGGAGGGGVDPARIRLKRIALKGSHPDWTPEQIEAEASKQILSEDAGKSYSTELGNTQKGENLGIKASVYDTLPQVNTNDQGQADPQSRQNFETELMKLPHGPSILDLIKQAADYSFDPKDITSRQVGQLNRAEFESMVHRYDPTWEASQFPVRQEVKKQWLPAGKAGQAMTSAKQVVGHLDALNKAGKILNKYQTDTAGGLTNWTTTNWARVFKSDKNAQKALQVFNTKRQAVADELKRLFTVVGSGSQQEIDSWLSLADPYKTPTEKKAFIESAGSLMKDRIRPQIENYQSVMGKPPRPGQSFGDLDFQRLQSMGVDSSDLGGLSAGPPPEAQALKPNEAIDMPNGDVWMRTPDGKLQVKRKQQ